MVAVDWRIPVAVYAATTIDPRGVRKSASVTVPLIVAAGRTETTNTNALATTIALQSRGRMVLADKPILEKYCRIFASNESTLTAGLIPPADKA